MWSSVGVVDLDACRPEFGWVPPRPFVGWKGTWLHEDEIVLCIGGPLAAGRLLSGRHRYAGPVDQPLEGDDWLALADSELPVGVAYDWAIQPQCGAVVLFSGTIRNHAEGRSGVEHLTYEAYDEQVVPRFAEIVAELRRRWPDTGRVALLHRLGRIEIGESSVIAVVSAPHRAQAFEAARFAIDALKESAPIWKHEVWEDGADWGTGAHDVRDPRSVGGPE